MQFHTMSAVHAALRIGAGAVTCMAIGASLSPAFAVCSPAAGNDVVSVCSGTTVAQGPGVATGFGSGTETNTMTTVLDGASVSGTSFGIDLSSGTLMNFGTITGNAGAAISVRFDTGTITNYGTIDGAAQNLMVGLNRLTLYNYGELSGTGSNAGVTAPTLDVTNYGTIRRSTGSLVSGTTVTVTNYGLLDRVTNNVGTAVNATNLNLRNSGTIQGGLTSVSAGAGSYIVNSGAIAHLAAFSRAIDMTGANSTLINTGSISTPSDNAVRMTGAGSHLLNSGTITARNNAANAAVALSAGVSMTNYGIVQGPRGLTGDGASVVNAGTIVGSAAGGHAVNMTNNATLTLLRGSNISGRALMSDSRLVIGAPLNANLTFATFNNVAVSGSGPYVVSGNRVASVDTSGLTVANAGVSDFASGASSLVSARFGSFGAGTTASAGGLAYAYAPEPYAAVPWPGARAATADPALTVWGRGFGGRREQSATDDVLANTSTAFGSAIGMDRMFGENLRAGVFIGGGSGRSRIAGDVQTVDSDGAFAGIYGRIDWGSHFIDATLPVGYLRNNSERRVNNNLAAGGLETATASYASWFATPEIALGLRLPVTTNLTATPALRARYTAAFYDSYVESGTSADLSMASRNTHSLEERAELTLSYSDPFSSSVRNSRTVALTGGAIAQQRLSGDSAAATLLGQQIVLTTPGAEQTYGGFAGLRADFRFGNVTFFGMAEAVWTNDNANTLTGLGGMRVAY